MCLSLKGCELRQATQELKEREGDVWSLSVAAGLLLYSQPDSGSFLTYALGSASLLFMIP